MSVILIVVGLFLYFLPTLLAVGKRNGGAIVVLNLLLGWTIIGWVGALIWAIVEKKTVPERQAAMAAQSEQRAAQRAARKKFCADCGTPLSGAYCAGCGKKVGMSGVESGPAQPMKVKPEPVKQVSWEEFESQQHELRLGPEKS